MRWKNAARGKNTCMPVRFADECACRQSGCQNSRGIPRNAHGAFVEPANYAAEPDSRLAENIRLAKQLGAQIRTLYGDDAAAVIAEYARVSGSTKIVIGRSPGKRGFFQKEHSRSLG